MFGLTIEKYDTRIWYFSRSHVFVTEKLDLHKVCYRKFSTFIYKLFDLWIQNFREIIHFALALGLASRVELGYDPTVRRVAVSSLPGPQYVYTVQGKDYITIATITTQKAKYLVSRAPRIFQVRRVIDLAREEFELEIKVLKDFWIPEDAQTDLQMQEYVRNNFQKVNEVPGLEIADFDDYFVVIEACEKLQVPSTRNPHILVLDDSSNFLRGRTLPQTFNWFHLSDPTSRTNKSSSISHSPEVTESDMECDYPLPTANDIAKLTFRSHYANKVHCRTLSEHAGETLEETKDWSTIMTALSKSVTGEASVFLLPF